MPHYFFDLRDRSGHHFDDAGVELPDLNAVQRAVEMALPRISAERVVGSGNGMDIEMIVRDAYDRDIMTATLAWSIHRHQLR